MNKAKVMQIINSIDLGLNIIEEGKQLDTQALTESVRIDVEDLKEELNSKPVMPKIFDKWMNYIEEDGQDNIELEFQLVLDMDTTLDKPSEDLRDWLNEEDSTYFIEKINVCTNAILNGYEVEK